MFRAWLSVTIPQTRVAVYLQNLTIKKWNRQRGNVKKTKREKEGENVMIIIKYRELYPKTQSPWVKALKITTC